MKRKTILLVEDNRDDVELALAALREHRIQNEVVQARDGQEALDLLLGKDGPEGRGRMELPALILLDLRLPRIDGMEVLRRLRDDPVTALVPVVVLTSSVEEEDVIRSYELGVNSYIRKPVDFEQFTETVRQLGFYWLFLNEVPPGRG